jgi:hypothetical protein
MGLLSGILGQMLTDTGGVIRRSYSHSFEGDSCPSIERLHMYLPATSRSHKTDGTHGARLGNGDPGRESPLWNP